MHCFLPASLTLHLLSHFTTLITKTATTQHIWTSVMPDNFHTFPLSSPSFTSFHLYIWYFGSYSHYGPSFLTRAYFPGSLFWRLNATKIDSYYVNTLMHALVPLASSCIEPWVSLTVWVKERSDCLGTPFCLASVAICMRKCYYVLYTFLLV